MSSTNNLKKCSTCGAEIAAKARVCPSCGAANKPPIYKRVWFWLVVVFIVVPVIATVGNSGDSSSEPANQTVPTTADSSTEAAANPTTAEPENSPFAGDCGIAASAEMGTNIIGMPTLTIHIQNTSDKDIAAIQFYAVPYDVYGEEITGWMATQRHLYTDDTISAGQSDELYYDPFIEDSIKTMQLYVYSVYFADGTEWGDKDASTSTILENGSLIQVYGES